MRGGRQTRCSVANWYHDRARAGPDGRIDRADIDADFLDTYGSFIESAPLGEGEEDDVELLAKFSALMDRHAGSMLIPASELPASIERMKRTILAFARTETDPEMLVSLRAGCALLGRVAPDEVAARAGGFTFVPQHASGWEDEDYPREEVAGALHEYVALGKEFDRERGGAPVEVKGEP